MFGLTPDQAWRLLPYELSLLAEAWALRRRDDMMRRAWEISHIIQVVTGKSYSPAELLGEAPPREVVESGDDSLVSRLRAAHARANFHDI